MDKRRFRNKNSHKSDNYKPPFPDNVLSEPVTNLSLREETSSLLLGANVSTGGDVLKRTETDFYKICKFNKKNLLDVKAAVKKRNLFLKPLPQKESSDDGKGNPDKRVSTAAQGNKQPSKSEQASKPIREDRQSKTQSEKSVSSGGGKEKKNKSDRETPYVMTTLPEKPPRPTKTVIKDEPDRYVKINKNGLWGFRDRNSKDMAVPAVYDEVFSFKEDLCCVQKDEKFGFINRQGEEIIPLIYDCATSFREGVACVFKGDSCGYIDINGETVVDFKYDAGTPVSNGECRVKKNGKWGELHIDNPDDVRWII